VGRWLKPLGPRTVGLEGVLEVRSTSGSPLAVFVIPVRTPCYSCRLRWEFRARGASGALRQLVGEARRTHPVELKFSRIVQYTRTFMLDSLSARTHSHLRSSGGQGRLSEDNIQEALREVRVALLEADVNFRSSAASSTA